MYFYIAASLIITSLIITITNCIFFSKPKRKNTVRKKSFSILIPARNEENNIEDCVRCLLLQGELVKEILIYNDHSEDNTAVIVNRLAQEQPMIKIIPCQDLPSGWGGKNYACSQLAANASGDWLLFVDADARLQPQAVGKMLSAAVADNLTFAAFWPSLVTITWAEKILMPMLNFIVFSMFPAGLAQLQAPGFKYNEMLGLAHGSCLLFDRITYEKFGGHARVKDQIFEDTRIAQLWRKSKLNGQCFDGQDLVQLRMYDSAKAIWLGFQKNIYPAFKHSISFWSFVFYHLVFYLLPFYFLIISPTKRLFTLIILILSIRFLLAIKFNQAFLSIFLHPFAEIVFILLAISSWWRCRWGKGVVWKGRAYQASV